MSNENLAPAYDFPQSPDRIHNSVTQTAPRQTPQAQPKPPAPEQLQLFSSSDRLPGKRVVVTADGTCVEHHDAPAK